MPVAVYALTAEAFGIGTTGQRFRRLAWGVAISSGLGLGSLRLVAAAVTAAGLAVALWSLSPDRRDQPIPSPAAAAGCAITGE